MEHHLRDKLGSREPKLPPSGGADAVLEDFSGDRAQMLCQRPDRHVLLGQERRQLAATSRTDEREQNRFFEGVMVDDLVERDDEFLEMLLLVRVARVDRPPSLGADDTVLEATNQ